KSTKPCLIIAKTTIAKGAGELEGSHKSHGAPLGEEVIKKAKDRKSTSVALVCDALKVPCFILRAMSDKAGEKAEFDFDEFVINSAKIS
ncbi:hypothetical protein VWM66_10275, partial [Campylobacter jejuni]